MRDEHTRVGKSSRSVFVIRVHRDSLLPDAIVERLRPLIPEGPLEEGTTIEQHRAVEFWSSSREAVRR